MHIHYMLCSTSTPPLHLWLLVTPRAYSVRSDLSPLMLDLLCLLAASSQLRDTAHHSFAVAYGQSTEYECAGLSGTRYSPMTICGV